VRNEKLKRQTALQSVVLSSGCRLVVVGHVAPDQRVSALQAIHGNVVSGKREVIAPSAYI
jgi:hypothetical protein